MKYRQHSSLSWVHGGAVPKSRTRWFGMGIHGMNVFVYMQSLNPDPDQSHWFMYPAPHPPPPLVKCECLHPQSQLSLQVLTLFPNLLLVPVDLQLWLVLSMGGMLQLHKHCVTNICFWVAAGSCNVIRNVFVMFGLIGDIPWRCWIIWKIWAGVRCEWEGEGWSNLRCGWCKCEYWIGARNDYMQWMLAGYEWQLWWCRPPHGFQTE